MRIENTTAEGLLGRYAEKIYPSRGELLHALEGSKLTIYHGVDPTAPQLHLGHTTNYLLLKGLQDLGHKVILLIGDFTAQIGDPTGKSQTRKPLTQKEVLQNSKTYQKQAGKILDFSTKRNPVQLRRNSTWLSKLTFEDVVRVAAGTTVSQMIQRDMFQERMKAGREIYLHEFLYPLMQGYDSVAMDVDAEVGGTDQTFNMLMGRDLMKALKKKEKFVITTPLLENPKTGRKLMSKSEGGYIALDDSPQDMYGKVMALPDEAIIPCLTLCTRVSLEHINDWKKNITPHPDPIKTRDAKAFLAKEIVAMYHGGKKAEQAEKEFERVFREKQQPSAIKKIKGLQGTHALADVLIKAKLAASKAQARRLIRQGGVRVDGQVQKEETAGVTLKAGSVVRVGKRHFVQIA